MGTTQSSWKKLSKIPINENFIQPVLFRDNELLIVPQTFYVNDVLFKYNMLTDEYNEWIKVEVKEVTDYGVSFPLISNNIIYIIMDLGHLATYNLETKKWSNIKPSAWHKDSCCFGGCVHVAINNEIHIIGGYWKDFHIIFNPNNNIYNSLKTKQTTLDGYDSQKKWTDAGLVYVKSKNKLLLFGGYSGRPLIRLNTIYSYDIMKEEWKTLNIKLIKPMEAFGCILTMDERFALIFGGTTSYGEKLNDIYIIDTQNMLIRKANINCPVKSEYYAYLHIFDSINNGLIVTGYITKCWKLKGLNGLKKPSNDIIKMIQTFHCDEIVHLFNRKNGHHWSIKIEHIINS